MKTLHKFKTSEITRNKPKHFKGITGSALTYRLIKNIFFLLFIFIAVSCEKGDIEENDLNTLNQIAKDFEAKIENTFARVDLLPSGDVVLATNTNKKEFDDRVYKEVIILAGRPNSSPIQESLGEVYLVNLKNIIIIQKSPTEFLNLIVNADYISNELGRLQKNHDIKIDDDNSYVGYGLSRIKGEWSIPDDISKFYRDGHEAIHYYNILQTNNPKDYEKTTCSSGGPGATTCTITEEYWGAKQGCTVTCGPGYYACCNASSFPTCPCIANASSGGGGDECNFVICIVPSGN
ncbi:hypothetical protein [Aquimarina sp. 2201CG5-10]|uniref:hypothetical protein n=1 Tax=Aquimarina callyspongiae TaxID=3098150 RepID=UPI002AB3A2A0|nr:hypothetical protein [Aquimarina sp. 2201CG5-10]MDY8137545.1 hypothetical protein [Aquimarina sp. 2201CG5-10]